MNIETSEKDGIARAQRDLGLCEKATRQYGRLIAPMLGAIPPGLATGHLVRVNPTLISAPPITLDRRRGFLAATQDGARAAGIDWTRLDEPTICAYSWCREVNTSATELYQENKDLYTTPDSNFWKTVYLRYVLGIPMFDVVWDQSGDYLYPALVYAVNTMRSFPLSMKKVVLVDLPYTFELATKKGGLHSKVFGIQPVLDKSRTQQVFMQPDEIGA